jgi:hypothetical protein
MDARHVLLLTATVAPRETPDLRLRDPNQREAHYLDALAQWCRALPPDWAIVVAENSSWPSARFTDVGERLGRSVQVLECADRGSQAGKGVGEAGLLDDFAKSDLARNCRWIFKCTGRLYVQNIDTCLPPLEDDGGVCGAIAPSLDHMDSRFFGASADVFHEYFTDMGREIREAEGLFFEHIAARRLLSSLAAGHPFRPFETLPYVIGHSASLGTSYHGRGVRIKGILRQRVRRMVMDREILI